MTSPARKAAPRCSIHFALAVLLLAVLAAALPLQGRALAQSFELPQELDENAPWTIEADKLVGMHDADILEAEGNVVLRQGVNYLQADFARYYRDTQWVYLRGNVRAGLGGDEIEAEEAEFDLANQVGWLTNGRIFLVEPHLYFTGQTVRKELGETYSFENAYVTACDACPAAWSFSADQGEVTVEGYAQLHGASLNILGQPVAYTPYMFIPAKTNRTSGLLFPDVGYSHNLGAYINLPIYIVIDEEQDITLYEYGMSERGFMQGVEYRNYLDLGTKTLVRFDWLYDQEIAREEYQENSPLNQDGLVRANHNRYWVRAMMDADLPYDFEMRADMDFVSDQNYLREFHAGLSGFNHSQQEFLDEFSRSLAESDQNRTSEILVTRDFERFAVSGSLEWNQSVEHGHGNAAYSRDPSLQRLPELSAYWFKDRLPGLEFLPLEFSAETDYTYFWRRYGTTGNRFEISPGLSLPLISDYGSIIPSVTWRNTFWDVDEYEQSTLVEGNDEIASRHLPIIQVTAFSELYNVYDFSGDPFPVDVDNVGESRVAALKHSIQPRIEYTGIPHLEQREYPFFDWDDRIEERQDLTYSLTNVVTTREETVAMATDADGSAEPALEVDYADALRLRLEQTYDFNEATRDSNPRYDRRPFSDILADVSINYLDYVSLSSKTWFSPYLGEITEHEHTLRVEIPDRFGAQMSFDFQGDVDEFTRQNREAISILRTQADVTLMQGLSFDVEYDYDLTNEQELMRGMTVNFQHQCFDASFSYSRTGLDERFEAWINLVGFNLF